MAPHVQFEPVGPSDTKWTTGFWAERFQTCRTATVPALGSIMNGVERSQFLHNFRIAAGMATGAHRGPPWNDGDYYKWIEAAAAVYAVSKDPSLDRQLDDAIAIIAKAQKADGYLHTPVLIKVKNGEPARPFGDRLNFEMYNFGHLFTAACVHGRATGKKSLFEIAVKAADFLCATFANPTADLARNSVCPAHFMGIIDMYRMTGNKDYLKLAEKWMDMRDLVRDGGDDNQDRMPFRKQTEAVGHAVRANYLYAGAADLYTENGDKSLLDPLMKIWASAMRRKVYVTGGCGALYDGASPDGAKNQKQIAKTHQAYGRDYQLPNTTAHNETCASTSSVLWNCRMLSITGDAQYADAMELALYNAVLAGVSLDGTKFFYTNTLRQLDSMPAELRWSRARQPWISSFCCPPNVARILAQVNRYAYSRSASAIWVHLYGGNALDTTLPDGKTVKLTQKTDYPWSGKVTLTVDAIPNRELAICLRIPAWAGAATLDVNGKPTQANLLPGSYAVLRRVWSAGDVVELTLPLRVRLLQAHPLVEETRNHVAIQRGPVVYCLESVDLDNEVSVMSVHIPRDTTFAARHVPQLFGGVTVLEGNANALREPHWGNELYREISPRRSQTIAIRLIPYFAWGNRGHSEMSVWLPLDP